MKRLIHVWISDVCIACGLKRRMNRGWMEYYVHGKWMSVNPLFACSRVLGDVDP